MPFNTDKFRFNAESFKENQQSKESSASFDTEELKEKLIPELIDELDAWHVKLQAEGKQGLILVLQALDAAGKDEIITFIFSHLMPQGLKVSSPNQPSEDEQDHDFLWRHQAGFPARGQIGILNRSYYEDVISLLVHGPEDQIPVMHESVEEEASFRLDAIRQMEAYLTRSGFKVIKLFPFVSKEVQGKRLLERMEQPDKQWEFSFSDLSDREKWDTFHKHYQYIMEETDTDEAPWYVLPADNAWLTRYLAGKIVLEALEELKPEFPVFTDEEAEKLEEAIQELKEELEEA